MKNILAILLLTGLLIPSCTFCANKVKQDTIKASTTEKKVLKKKASKNALAKYTAEITSDSIAKEQRKREIEAKERTVNKTKKVKMFEVDEYLSKTIQKRNIP